MVRRSRFVAAVIVVTCLLVGCAYDWSFPGGVDPSIDGGGGDSSKDTSTNDAPIGDTGNLDVSPPLPVECKLSSECGPGKYCDFSDDSCGETTMGKCVAIETPPVCSVSRVVCGCSKAVYANSCDATKAGDDLSVKAPCPTTGLASGLFRCGVQFCKPGAEFCVVSKAKGTSCASTTCNSLSDHKCGSGCPDIDARASSGCLCKETGSSPNEITFTDCP